MTSRYALYDTGSLSDRFALTHGAPKGTKPHYDISPTQSISVVVSQGEVREHRRMKWGFISKGAADTNGVFHYKTYNARMETVFRQSIWQTAIRAQRCITPANGFYEWKKSAGSKTPYYFTSAEQPLMGIAGLYSSWIDPAGKEWGVAAMIIADTDAASDTLPSRLPVLVAPEHEADWLNPSVDDINTLYRIMRPCDTSKLTFVQVGDAVNSTKNNQPSLIDPVA